MTTTRTALVSALALMAGALATPHANAVDVLWTVSGVTFDDGGTVSGSFVFDAQTDTYSSIRLVSTFSTAFSGAGYGDPLSRSPGNSIVLVAVPNARLPDAGQSLILLEWVSALTDAGGITSVRTSLGGGNSVEGKLFDNTGGAQGYRVVTSGGTVSAVPEPATFGLMGLGVAGLLAWRQRRGPAVPGHA